MSTINAATAMLKRDLTRALRRRSQLLHPLLFFLIITSLFPFAVGPESATLALIGPGIIWVAAVLSSTLSLEGIFRSDYEDGTLEQMVLSPHPLSVLMLAKITAHWLLSEAPLVLVAAPLGAMLGVPTKALGALVVTLLLGTPLLSLVGATASALTVGLRGGGLLLALIILPLYIPVLIFGTAATRNAAVGLPFSGQIIFLGGLAVMALTLAPLATAASLRIRMS